MEQFLSLTEQADFPYISCNFNHEGELVFEPYLMKEVNGTKIAFVGVTTPETLTSSTPKYFQDEEGEFVYGFCQDETGEALYHMKLFDRSACPEDLLLLAKADHFGRKKTEADRETLAAGYAETEKTLQASSGCSS